MNKLLVVLSLLLGPAVAHAGRVGGASRHEDRVRPSHQDSYELRFHQDDPALILVTGDGSTDLDCTVYDSDKNTVASDVNPRDYCVLRWTPERGRSNFTLKIKNYGDVVNRYVVQTN